MITATAQKMKFFIKDFFSKCDQIRSPELTTRNPFSTNVLLTDKPGSRSLLA